MLTSYLRKQQELAVTELCRSVDYVLRQPTLYPTAKASGFYGDFYKSGNTCPQTRSGCYPKYCEEADLK